MRHFHASSELLLQPLTILTYKEVLKPMLPPKLLISFLLFSFLPATSNPNSQAQFPINHEFLQVGIFDFHS